MPTQLVGGPRSTLVTGAAGGAVRPTAFGGNPAQVVRTRDRSRVAPSRPELLVQQGTGTSAATTIAVTMPMVPTPGNYLLGFGTDPGVAAIWPLPSTSGASWARVDDRGNAWGLFGFDGIVKSGMAAAITVTADNSGGHGVNISEWTGTAGYIKQSISSNATSASLTTSTIEATCAGGSLIIAAFDTAGGATITVGAGGGFTDLQQANQGGRIIQVAYKYVTGGTHTATWTLSGSQNYDAFIIEVPLLPAATANALLVVGDPAALTTLDYHVQQRLMGNGFAVTLIDDVTAEPAMTGIDLVVIAESSVAATLGTKYKTVKRPVLYLDLPQALSADLVGDSSNTTTATTTVDITASSNAGAGWQTGSAINYFRYTNNLQWTTVASLPAGANVFMKAAAQATEAMGATYERGSTLLNSHTAEHRRAFITLYVEAYNNTSPYPNLVPSWLHFDGLVSWAVGSRYRDLVIADGPIGYWRLGEPIQSTAHDEMHVSDGSFTGSPSRVAGALIHDGDGSITLDGSSQYVSVPHVVGLNQGNGPFSWECWFRPSAVPTIAGGVLMMKGTGATGSPTLQFDTVVPGRLLAYSIGWGQGAHSSVAVADTLSHHVVMTKTALHVWSLFLDGVDVTVSDTAAQTGNEATALEFGRKTDGTQYFGGAIDEVALYSAILTPTQIQNHYLAGRGVYADPYGTAVVLDDPVAFFRFDDTLNDTADSMGAVFGARYVAEQGIQPLRGFVPGAPTGDIDRAVVLNDGGFVGQYGIAPSQSVLAALADGPFSYEIWFKLEAGALGGQAYLFQHGSGEGVSCKLIASGAIDVSVPNSNSGVTSSALLTDTTTWHQAVVTKAVSDTSWKIYVDGVDSTSNPGANSCNAATVTANPLWIGTQANGGNNMVGYLDDLSIYNVELTPTQVSAHYVAAGGVIATGGGVAYPFIGGGYFGAG